MYATELQKKKHEFAPYSTPRKHRKDTEKWGKQKQYSRQVHVKNNELGTIGIWYDETEVKKNNFEQLQQQQIGSRVWLGWLIKKEREGRGGYG